MAALGPEVNLALDAHWRYRPHEILAVARGLEGCPTWFDETLRERLP